MTGSRPVNRGILLIDHPLDSLGSTRLWAAEVAQLDVSVGDKQAAQSVVLGNQKRIEHGVRLQHLDVIGTNTTGELGYA